MHADIFMRSVRIRISKLLEFQKTIDNDIAMTDHSPGYGSGKIYCSLLLQEVEDVKSLPFMYVLWNHGKKCRMDHSCIGIARRKQGDAPHLIYLPNETSMKMSSLKMYQGFRKTGEQWF